MSELVPDPGAAAAAPEPTEPLVADLGGQPAPEPATPLESAPPAPAVDPVELQAELEYMREQYATLASAVGNQTPQQQPAQQPGAPFDPSRLVDEYGQLNPAALVELLTAQQQGLAQFVDQRFQQIQAPLAAQQEASVVAQGEERLNSMLADDVARNGQFVADPAADAEARTLVRTLAEQMFPEIEARYGATPRSAEIALSKAATQVRNLLRAAGVQATTQQATQLATLAGAPSEPGATTGGVAGVPQLRSPGEVVAYYSRQAQQLVSAPNGNGQ